MKFHDWQNIWHGSGIGYKLINLAIIIAIISNIAVIILAVYKKKPSALFETDLLS